MTITIESYNGIEPKIHESVFLRDGARIIGDVVLEKDVNVWYNTVIRGDVNYIRVGERTNIQDNSMLHVTWQKYPLIVGADVTVGHNVVLHGCTVKDSVLIGMGAILLDNCVVNSNSLVAAGTLIKEGFEVPEGVLVAGVPGKIVRDLRSEEIEKIAQSARNYLFYVENYRKEESLKVKE
ncbi:MAG TPA: gamma carbonic anhydrase family protein [Ignavibacteria bacterium]|nr:gamma carbonic anhydrase family protein [Ignavibacteria bacterium]